MFVGYYATLVRDIPYTMLELGIYENLKVLISKFKRGSSITSSEEMIAAAFTGGIASYFTTPLDLVKTKLMIQVSLTFLLYNY